MGQLRDIMIILVPVSLVMTMSPDPVKSMTMMEAGVKVGRLVSEGLIGILLSVHCICER
jgi:hypothetical protein